MRKVLWHTCVGVRQKEIVEAQVVKVAPRRSC